MFDAQLRGWIDPALDRLAGVLAKTGISANSMTVAGACVGMSAAVAIAQGATWLGLLLVMLNRLMDGLDGAVARRAGPTEWGGYLDSLADYVFYVALPLGFAFAAKANIVPAQLLIASFTLTAVSFLALAAILARRNMQDAGHGEKAFTYSTGLMEGGETIAFFIAMCLFPGYFPYLALVFAALCIATVGQRLWLARRLLR
jgi:phosphatidylglycerophosphate synthase